MKIQQNTPSYGCSTTSSMNIAFVSDYAHPYTKGGVEMRYYELSQYLLSKGHKVTWFTTREWDGGDEKLINGIRLRGISDRILRYSGNRRSIKQALFFGLCSIRFLFCREKYDIVDMSQYPFFHILVGNLYGHIRNTPVIITWYEFWGDHWFEYLRGIYGFVGKFIERFISKIAGNKIVISKQSMSQLVAVGCDPKSLHYVPNWIDYEQIINLPALGLPYDVCYFGRLKDHKNVDILLRAVALCRDEGLVLRTRIIGKGPERQTLQELAQELGLDSQVEFLGLIEKYHDLIGIVKSSRLFVNPSTKEGGGSITCLEANACGIPVLAVQHPLGLDQSLIAEGQNGYWAREATPRALGDKLHQHFQSSAAHREKMSQIAVEWSSQYDVKRLCNRIEMIYAEHAAKNRKGFNSDGKPDTNHF